jgi:hypothetical protein
MNLERYEIVRMNEFSYRFFSIGPKGVFKMHIHFTMTGANSFNLGFGVLDSSHEWLDDMIEVRNGDTQKILATVAHTALVFLEEHPLRNYLCIREHSAAHTVVPDGDQPCATALARIFSCRSDR